METKGDEGGQREAKGDKDRRGETRGRDQSVVRGQLHVATSPRRSERQISVLVSSFQLPPGLQKRKVVRHGDKKKPTKEENKREKLQTTKKNRGIQEIQEKTKEYPEKTKKHKKRKSGKQERNKKIGKQENRKIGRQENRKNEPRLST
jgi:hypothetical protein